MPEDTHTHTHTQNLF